MRRERGVALLLAMLVLALSAMLATRLLEDGQRRYQQQRARALQQQAWQLALGVERWASRLLVEDARRNQHDSLAEDWARPVVNLQVEGGTLSGRLQDLSGRFNLNNLLGRDGRPDPLWLERYRRLLARLGLSSSLADSLLDWLDADSQPRPSGAEDGLYLGRGYRARNGRIQALAELSRVAGYTPEVLQRLRPHVAALPPGRTLNVNTATAPVLQAVIPELGADLAAGLQREGEQGFDSLEAFVSRLRAQGIVLQQGLGLGVRSQDFLLRVRLQQEERQLALRMHLHREGQRIQVLSRETDADDH